MQLLKSHLLICGVLLIELATTIAGAQQYPYALIQLPHRDPNRPGSVTRAINEAGDLCGGSDASDGTYHAVTWGRDGRVLDLGTLLGPYSFAKALNDQEEVAGWSSIEPTGNSKRAFYWSMGQMIDLGTLGGTLSEANSVNESDQIVGWAGYDLSSSAAFVWESGQMRELPSYVQRAGTAFGVNNQGS